MRRLIVAITMTLLVSAMTFPSIALAKKGDVGLDHADDKVPYGQAKKAGDDVAHPGGADAAAERRAEREQARLEAREGKLTGIENAYSRIEKNLDRAQGRKHVPKGLGSVLNKFAARIDAGDTDTGESEDPEPEDLEPEDPEPEDPEDE